MVADCGCEIALKLLVFQSVEGDMVGRGFHLDFLDSKCSSHASCSHVFILGKRPIIFFIIFIIFFNNFLLLLDYYFELFIF